MTVERPAELDTVQHHIKMRSYGRYKEGIQSTKSVPIFGSVVLLDDTAARVSLLHQYKIGADSSLSEWKHTCCSPLFLRTRESLKQR